MRPFVPLALVASTLLLAGCSGPPTQVATVTEDGLRARDAPQCEVLTVGDGPSLLARLRCIGGSGVTETSLAGCSATSKESSWLSLTTQEGRLARGKALATVAGDGAELARLAVDASSEDGKEAMLGAAGDYVLRVELDAWQGEWIEATVECPAAAV